MPLNVYSDTTQLDVELRRYKRAFSLFSNIKNGISDI